MQKDSIAVAASGNCSASFCPTSGRSGVLAKWKKNAQAAKIISGRERNRTAISRRLAVSRPVLRQVPRTVVIDRAGAGDRQNGGGCQRGEERAPAGRTARWEKR